MSNNRIIIAEVSLGETKAVIHRRMTVQERMARDPWYVKGLRFALRKAYKAVKWCDRNRTVVKEWAVAVLSVLAVIAGTAVVYAISRAVNPFHEEGFSRAATSFVQALAGVGALGVGFVIIRDWIRDFVQIHRYVSGKKCRHQGK